jgi:hypothetical protein
MAVMNLYMLEKDFVAPRALPAAGEPSLDPSEGGAPAAAARASSEAGGR